MRSLCASLTIVTALLLAVPAHAQKRSDVSRDNLIGPVHTAQLDIAEIRTIDGKEVETWRRPHQKVVYNRRGNEIERISFSEGSITSRTVHTVDAHGRISGFKEYEVILGKGEQITCWSKWRYDKTGNRIEARTYRGKVLTHQTLTSYNRAGLVIEETMISDGGKWKQTTKYSYDSKGHRTRTLFDTNGATELSEEAHDEAGNLTSYQSSAGKSKCVYDARGKQIECNTEDAHSTSKVLTSYDGKGRVWRRITQFDYKRPNMSSSHAPTPGTVEFRYNESDKLVEETAYATDGRLRLRTVNEYDGNGRIRSQVKFNGNSIMISKVTYEYDSWGNPVKTIKTGLEYNGKTSTHIEYRVITYHQSK